MILLDASVAIALLGAETGGDVVRTALESDEGLLSVVNFAEVLEDAERSGGGARGRFEELRAAFRIVPMTAGDALDAAQLYTTTRRPSLSLADRVALATARRLGLPVLTADGAWSNVADVDVRVIR
jgi:PIN domain nuclease of toxin-antitoxin system